MQLKQDSTPAVFLGISQNNPEYSTRRVSLLNNETNGRNTLSFPVPHRNVATRKTAQKKMWLATCTWKPKFPGSILLVMCRGVLTTVISRVMSKSL